MRKYSSKTGAKTAVVLAVLILSSTVTWAEEGAGSLRASHEDMADPTATTDDFGLTVPIPISFPARRYPAAEGYPTGPEVGDLMPDFELPDQNGDLVNFQTAREGKKAAVVFFRSAVW